MAPIAIVTILQALVIGNQAPVQASSATMPNCLTAKERDSPDLA
jgi:hypothetical protein